MKIRVSEAAAQWIADQLGVKAGATVALFAKKSAGQTTIGYRQQAPDRVVASVDQAGVTFFVDFAEEWFFSGKETALDYQGGDQLTCQQTAEAVTGSTKMTSAAPANADASTSASRRYEEYWE